MFKVGDLVICTCGCPQAVYEVISVDKRGGLQCKSLVGGIDQVFILLEYAQPALTTVPGLSGVALPTVVTPFASSANKTEQTEQALCSCNIIALMQAGCKCGGK